MGVSPAVVRDGGGRITGGVDLRLPSPEHSRTVHFDQAHYVPVSGGGSKARVKGCQAVVVAGRIGLGGDLEGGSVGGTDEGGKRRRAGRRGHHLQDQSVLLLPPLGNP